MISVNTTSDGPMLKYAKGNRAHIIMVQEHHAPSGRIPGLSAKMRKNGFKFCASSAVGSGRSAKGTTGGVAVCVKDCYGVDPVLGVSGDDSDPWTVHPGRAAGVRVHGFVKGGVLIFSIYLKSGEAPDSTDNWAILCAVSEVIAKTKLPYMVGGVTTNAHLMSSDALGG